MQIQIRASDQASPEKTADTVVQVNVRRDQSVPTLVPGNYNRTIDVTHPIGERPVVQIRAVDPDRVGELTFELKGVYPADHFFTIDESNGNVFVLESLKEDNLQLTQYTVSVRYPSRSGLVWT